MHFRRVIESFGLTIVFAILALLCDSVQGINCVQCSSLEDFRCSEKANPGDLQSLPCYGVQNSQYCVKMTGVFDGQLGTKRFCSDRYLHNFCDYIRRPGDGREYRSCIYTCQGDGCNGAASMGLSIASLFAAALLLLWSR